MTDEDSVKYQKLYKVNKWYRELQDYYDHSLNSASVLCNAPRSKHVLSKPSSYYKDPVKAIRNDNYVKHDSGIKERSY